MALNSLTTDFIKIVTPKSLLWLLFDKREQYQLYITTTIIIIIIIIIIITIIIIIIIIISHCAIRGTRQFNESQKKCCPQLRMIMSWKPLFKIHHDGPFRG